MKFSGEATPHSFKFVLFVVKKPIAHGLQVIFGHGFPGKTRMIRFPCDAEANG
jgi:hypothetical protein